jgi:hypothetical protein
MSGFWLVLGWNRLLHAEKSSLPAIRALCRALEIGTEWHEESATLFLEPPVSGKRILVLPSAHPGEAALSQRVTEQLLPLLRAAGAVAGMTPGAGTAAVADATARADLLLVLRAPVAQRPWGLAASYPLSGWRRNSRLARLLMEESAAAAGIPCLSTRPSLRTDLAGHRRGGARGAATLLLGMPERAEEEERVADEQFPAALAQGIFRALSRFWADPVLTRLVRLMGTEPSRGIDPLSVHTEPGPPARLVSIQFVAESVPVRPPAAPQPDKIQPAVSPPERVRQTMVLGSRPPLTKRAPSAKRAPGEKRAPAPKPGRRPARQAASPVAYGEFARQQLLHRQKPAPATPPAAQAPAHPAPSPAAAAGAAPPPPRAPLKQAVARFTPPGRQVSRSKLIPFP